MEVGGLMWQDYVIAIVVLVFNLTTVPMIRARVVLPWLTVLPMCIGAGLLMLVYASMDLWFAEATEFVAIMLWTMLFCIKCEEDTYGR